MIDFTNWSESNSEEILEKLRTEHHLETYGDFSIMLKEMAIMANYMLEYNNAPMDDVEKNNLINLRELLSTCSEMMWNCDSYYRER